MCGKLQTGQWLQNAKKFYVRTCKCGNRCHSYVPILEIIRNEILNYKETVLSLIADVDFNDKSKSYEFELKQLQMQLDMKALDKIEILFEEDEIDLKRYKRT